MTRRDIDLAHAAVLFIFIFGFVGLTLTSIL
jgi:hypothetical protein